MERVSSVSIGNADSYGHRRCPATHPLGFESAGRRIPSGRRDGEDLHHRLPVGDRQRRPPRRGGKRRTPAASAEPRARRSATSEKSSSLAQMASPCHPTAGSPPRSRACGRRKAFIASCSSSGKRDQIPLQDVPHQAGDGVVDPQDRPVDAEQRPFAGPLHAAQGPRQGALGTEAHAYGALTRQVQEHVVIHRAVVLLGLPQQLEAEPGVACAQRTHAIECLAGMNPPAFARQRAISRGPAAGIPRLGQ